MNNSWRALARMARDKLVHTVNDEDAPLIFDVSAGSSSLLLSLLHFEYLPFQCAAVVSSLEFSRPNASF